MSQKAKIIAYMKDGHSLTVIDGISKFGCYALSQRMGELKRDGYPIITTMIKTKFSKKQIASYRLAEIN